MNSSSPARFLRLIVEKIEVRDIKDPCWIAPGELRFCARIVPDGDVSRAVVVRFPTTGVYKMEPGTQMLARLVFQGRVRESLELEITGLEEDFIGKDDPLTRYRRVLRGAVLSRNDSYAPGDEVADPESMGDWRLWFRVEVKTSVESESDALPSALRAHRHKKNMRMPRRAADDPGGKAPGGDLRAVCVGRHGKQVLLEAAEHPRPGGLGDTGRVVRLDAKALMAAGMAGPGGSARAYGGVLLQIALARNELRGINPALLRVVRWDEARKTFTPEARSGAGRNGIYAWAYVTEPGIYGVRGLPSDRATLDTLRMARIMIPWLGLHADTRAEFPEDICNFILCRPNFRDALIDPDLLESLGLGDMGGDLNIYGDRERTNKGKPMGRPPILEAGPERMENVCDFCFGGLGELMDEGWVPPDPDVDLGADRPAGALGDGQPREYRWGFEGPEDGGRVKALAWDPVDENIVYAGNSQGGVYRSMNGGMDWDAMMHAEPSLAIGSLVAAADPETGDTILYAGTGEYRADTNYFDGGNRPPNGAGLAVSRDGGETWMYHRTGNINCSRVLLAPDDPDLLFLSGINGIERSLDGGESWEFLLGGPGKDAMIPVSDIVLDPADPRIMYACRDDGEWIQVNDDTRAAAADVRANWRPMNGGLSDLDGIRVNTGAYGKFAAAPDGNGGRVLWCQLSITNEESPRPDTTVFRMNFAEEIWERREGVDGFGSFFILTSTQTDYNSVLVLKPGTTDFLFAGSVFAHWSPDGGLSWRAFEGAVEGSSFAWTGHADNHAFAFDPRNPDRWLTGNDGGLFEVNAPPRAFPDGAVARNNGHDTLQFYCVSVSESGPLLLGGGTQDQGVWARGRGPWQVVDRSEFCPFQAAPDGTFILWNTGSRGLLRYATPLAEGGFSESREAHRGMTDENGTGLAALNIAIHQEDPNIILAANFHRLFQSKDGALAPNDDSTPGDGFREVLRISEAPDLPLVQLPSGAMHGLPDFTFACWIREAGASSFPFLDGLAERGFHTGLRFEAGEWVGTVWERSARFGVLEDVNLDDGNWHHIVWQRRGEEQRLAVNGVVRGSGSARDFPLEILNQKLVLGRSFGPGENPALTADSFQGEIDDVRVYARALSDQEIADLHGGSLEANFHARFTFNKRDISNTRENTASGSFENIAFTHGRNALGFPFGSATEKNYGARFRSASSTAFSTLEFSPADPVNAFAGTFDGKLFRSRDAGETWEPMGAGPLGALRIVSITADWDDPDVLFITYGRDAPVHVWGSVDGGASWEDMSGGAIYSIDLSDDSIPDRPIQTERVALPDSPAYRVIIDKRFSQAHRLYVALENGVYRSRTGGLTWEPFDLALPNAPIYDMAYRPQSHRLYVATFGRGIYSLDLQ